MKYLCVLLLSFGIGAASAAAATVTDVSGMPQIMNTGAGWQKAAKGMALKSADRVRCGAGERMEIRTANGHKIKIWPKSEVVLSSIDGEQTGINLVMGRMRSWVKKLRGRDKFEVKTPIAVCSVRGTDFTVELGNDQKMKVEVFEGQVAAREESTGSEVMVREGEFTQIQANQPPAAPEKMTGDGSAAPANERQILNESREEARVEIFQEISREAVLARSNEEIKLAEYQNGKALVDASGNRVRLEEYIVRTQPKEFKYVVLNNREDRFDFGKIIFTFNEALPGDLTLATRTLFSADGAVKPRWWLTDVLSVMSNTQDQVNEVATGGNMYADNEMNPASWTLGFRQYTFLVGTGGGEPKKWWEFNDENRNGSLDNGEISFFRADGTTPLDGTPTSEFALPSGADAMHYYSRDTYVPGAGGQWIAAEDYVINDEGNILALENLQGLTSGKLKEMAYNANFERVYTCSEFGGRKIDLVFSSKLLIDAGMLKLPDPRQISQ